MPNSWFFIRKKFIVQDSIAVLKNLHSINYKNVRLTDSTLYFFTHLVPVIRKFLWHIWTKEPHHSNFSCFFKFFFGIFFFTYSPNHVHNLFLIQLFIYFFLNLYFLIITLLPEVSISTTFWNKIQQKKIPVKFVFVIHLKRSVQYSCW
jgi:hypothetical protein